MTLWDTDFYTLGVVHYCKNKYTEILKTIQQAIGMDSYKELCSQLTKIHGSWSHTEALIYIYTAAAAYECNM